MDFFYQLDIFLLHYINHVWRNAFLDWCMPIFRDAKTWLPIYIMLVYFSWKKYGQKGLVFVVLIALSASAADLVSSRFVKPTFHRVRPCNEPQLSQEVINIVPCGSGFSFTSSHAANHFAVSVAICLTLFQKRKKLQVVLFLWATLIGYAQIYVGVHYPIDVISGAMLGAMLAFLVVKNKYSQRWLKNATPFSFSK